MCIYEEDGWIGGGNKKEINSALDLMFPIRSYDVLLEQNHTRSEIVVTDKQFHNKVNFELP